MSEISTCQGKKYLPNFWKNMVIHEKKCALIVWTYRTCKCTFNIKVSRERTKYTTLV